MSRYLIIIALFLTTGQTLAQKQKSRLIAIKSETARHVVKNGVSLLMVYKGLFLQNNTYFSSDSAYLHEKENVLEAFGHVLISQGDTLNVYGDKLHYEGKTKVAIMTENVRMVDRDAILTTNYLTYNTETKIGTYAGGGKLVNKDNVLTSKNGYYFSSTRDAYFRYNVILNTADAIIQTDTLRYNSGSRIAYFYGPTNILGKKDNDTLYTENGLYNTTNEQAFFGKKNLYKQGTKSLKGDSLFYDRLVGYGRAINNVVFNDSEQKTTLYGGLGEYFKKEERILMTIHPYVVFVTEENDTTKTDLTNLERPTINNKTNSLDSPLNIGTIFDSTIVTATSKQNVNVTHLKDSIIHVDSVKLQSIIVKQPSISAKELSVPTFKVVKNKNVIQSSDYQSTAKRPTLSINNIDSKNFNTVSNSKINTKHIKRDSIFLTADSIETQIIIWKSLRIIKQTRLLAGLRDTSIRNLPSIVYTKPLKFIEKIELRMSPDTSMLHREYFKLRDATKNLTLKSVSAERSFNPTNNEVSKASISARLKKITISPKKEASIFVDSLNISQTSPLTDTARVRLITAAHHAKIFKSDLQAKADSISFSYSDSVARMYLHPIIWVQGSQLSGDTINLQMKQKKLDNLEMFPAAFIVNVEKGDTTHFNQVGGKKMRGYFKNSKIEKMFISGNAETIYWDRDKGKVSRMQRTISSKIRVNFKNNNLYTITQYIKDESRVIPLDLIKDDDKILKNFIWKPNERPISKDAILSASKTKSIKNIKKAKGLTH